VHIVTHKLHSSKKVLTTFFSVTSAHGINEVCVYPLMFIMHYIAYLEMQLSRHGEVYVKIYSETKEYVKFHSETKGCVKFHSETKGCVKFHYETRGYVKSRSETKTA
jgi:hypothetical protein